MKSSELNRIKALAGIKEEEEQHDGRISKVEAQYTGDAPGEKECHKCSMFRPPHACSLVEGFISPEGVCKYFKPHGYEDDEELDEKWGKPTVVSPSEKGKYKGKSLQDLRSSLAALKKSGPHHKDSPEYGRMKELQFAIRAKTGWGKV